jgi:hypothetical protein
MSHVQTAPLWPLNVPARCPLSVNQRFTLLSFPQVTNKSPSRLNLQREKMGLHHRRRKKDQGGSEVPLARRGCLCSLHLIQWPLVPLQYEGPHAAAFAARDGLVMSCAGPAAAPMRLELNIYIYFDAKFLYNLSSPRLSRQPPSPPLPLYDRRGSNAAQISPKARLPAEHRELF